MLFNTYPVGTVSVLMWPTDGLHVSLAITALALAAVLACLALRERWRRRLPIARPRPVTRPRLLDVRRTAA